MINMKKPKDVDEYISRFPEETQERLQQIREAISEIAPEAVEVISYSMPAFKYNGIVVWFGGHTNHIGFYPRVSAMVAFKKELSIYKSAKGSVQFPLDKPLPIGLIKKMVKFRVTENLLKLKVKNLG